MAPCLVRSHSPCPLQVALSTPRLARILVHYVRLSVGSRWVFDNPRQRKTGRAGSISAGLPLRGRRATWVFRAADSPRSLLTGNATRSASPRKGSAWWERGSVPLGLRWPARSASPAPVPPRSSACLILPRGLGSRRWPWRPLLHPVVTERRLRPLLKVPGDQQRRALVALAPLRRNQSWSMVGRSAGFGAQTRA